MDDMKQMLERFVMDNDECCGCALCAAQCPRHAIRMEQGKTGFWRPLIDEEACIRCGYCLRTCQSLHQKGRSDVMSHSALDSPCQAMWMNDERKIMQTTSGGVLTALAERVIALGGVVSGAVMDESVRPVRIITESMEGVAAMAGSKYVQCRCNPDLYRQIKEYLSAGRLVLFVGTPCQVSALNRYVGKVHPMLLSADFLCHGTPSPLLLEKYVKWREGRHGDRMVHIGFRGKEIQGWARSSIDCHFAGGKVIHTRIDFDPYYGFFAGLLSVNKTCFSCRYSSLDRVSDLTCMDYWHAPVELQSVRGRRGASLVVANTDKAQIMLRQLVGDGTLRAQAVDLESYYHCQPAFCGGASMPHGWEKFMEELPRLEFADLCRKYLPQKTLKYKLKGMAKWYIARFIRMIRGE